MKVRPVAADDAEALLALSIAADVAATGESDWTEPELLALLEGVELERDSWVIELDGAIAGYATVDVRHGDWVVSDGYVHPEHRNRGVGGELLRLAETRALEEPGRPLRLSNQTYANDPCSPNLYAAHGYEPARRLWFMTLDLGEGVPDEGSSPVALRAFVRADDDRIVHAAEQEAFEGHPRGPETFEAWTERHFGPEFEAGLWHVAEEDGEIAGYLISRRDPAGGYVHMVGVRPPWRGRGIGEALLRRAVSELARRGEQRVSLTVDSVDPVGATRLYERVGFRILTETVVYEKVLAELRPAG